MKKGAFVLPMELLSGFTRDEIEKLSRIARDALNAVHEFLHNTQKFLEDCEESARERREFPAPRHYEVFVGADNVIFHQFAQIYGIPITSDGWLSARKWRSARATSDARLIELRLRDMRECRKRYDEFTGRPENFERASAGSFLQRVEALERVFALASAGPVHWCGSTSTSAHEAAISVCTDVLGEWEDFEEDLKINGPRSDLRRVAEFAKREYPEWFHEDEMQQVREVDRIETLIRLEEAAVIRAYMQMMPRVPRPVYDEHDRRAESIAVNLEQGSENSNPAVILRGRDEPALVRGTPKELNGPQYDLVEALVNARPNGLTKDSIERIRTDARGILRRLRRDADWEQVIHMAGTTSGRYRIS